MEDIASESKTNREDQAIQEFFNFDLAQESSQAMFDREEELRLLLDRNRPLSELQDILRLAIRSNALKLVKVLVKEKGVIPDTDTLYYALVNAESSVEASKMDKEYSIKIFKYLMKKTRYMEVGFDGPQEKLNLQEKQENFIEALIESRYICINNIIWNKDKQSIEFEDTWLLERKVLEEIKNCPEFIVDTDRSTLTIYEVLKNRLIASVYLEGYCKITKAEQVNDRSDLLNYLRGECPSIQLAILQLPDVYIKREKYADFLINSIFRKQIKSTTALQALLRCKDENGQVMIGDKAKNREWCIKFCMAISDDKVEDIASLLDIDYSTHIYSRLPKQDYREDSEYKSRSWQIICKIISIRLEKTAFTNEISQADKKEEAGSSFKPDPIPSVSSFAKGKS
jgi:hypothetical protein